MALSVVNNYTPDKKDCQPVVREGNVAPPYPQLWGEPAIRPSGLGGWGGVPQVIEKIQGMLRKCGPPPRPCTPKGCLPCENMTGTLRFAFQVSGDARSCPIGNGESTRKCPGSHNGNPRPPLDVHSGPACNCSVRQRKALRPRLRSESLHLGHGVGQ